MASKATMADESKGVEQWSDLDAEIWGSLQHHIGLERVYAKLPFREFFQLRLVCKDWNRLASDRAFLEESFKDHVIPKPYFLLNAQGLEDLVRGLLTYDHSSGLWNWTRIPSGNIDFLPMEGLVYGYQLENKIERQVLNLHTRVWIPLPPTAEVSYNWDPFAGMIVDTSVRPYAFKVIQGSHDMGTQIYDSKTNSWTTRPSRQFGMSPGQAIMAYCKGVIYIRCELDTIVCYDMEKDEWSEIDPPRGDSDDFLRGVGAWQGRLFIPSVDPEQQVIRVWELVGQSEWKEFDCMPGELYSWIFYEKCDPPVDITDMQILASYCDENVLLYAWVYVWVINEEESVAKAERLVLFNLATKAWQKLEPPFGAISEQ